MGEALSAADHWGNAVRDAFDRATTNADTDDGGVFEGIEHLRDPENFPEFCSRFLRVQDPDKNFQLSRLHLRWIQRQIWRKERELIRAGEEPWIIVLKYRRGGVTTLYQALQFHAIWSQPNTKCWTYAQRAEDTEEIFEAVSRFYEHFPEVHRHEKTPATRREIKLKRPWDSKYGAQTAGAKGSGRGGGYMRVHYSEAAFYSDFMALHGALTPTLPDDGISSIESTPNGKEGDGEDFYNTYRRAKAGASAYTPLFFAWHDDPANVRPIEGGWDGLGEIEPHEQGMVRRYDLSPEQLAWWRKEKDRLAAVGRVEEHGGDDVSLMLQEYPNDDESCFLEGGRPWFAAGYIEKARRQVRKPLSPAEVKEAAEDDEAVKSIWEDNRLRNHLERGELRLYRLPDPDKRYIGGADTAEGRGGDDNAAALFEMESGEQVLAYNCNTIPPDLFGSDVLAKLGYSYAARGVAPAYWAVERENHGHAVLSALKRQVGYPISSIHRYLDDSKKGEKAAKIMGWKNSKNELSVAVARMLRESFPKVRDEETVRSIERVTDDGTGAPEFNSRDLCVAAGIVSIVLPQRAGRAGLMT